MNDDWTETRWELSNGAIITVYHNLGEQIFAAFDNWIARTSTYTSKSFVNYIRLKANKFTTGHIAYEEKEYFKRIHKK